MCYWLKPTPVSQPGPTANMQIFILLRDDGKEFFSILLDLRMGGKEERQKNLHSYIHDKEQGEKKRISFQME